MLNTCKICKYICKVINVITVSSLPHSSVSVSFIHSIQTFSKFQALLKRTMSKHSKLTFNIHLFTNIVQGKQLLNRHLVLAKKFRFYVALWRSHVSGDSKNLFLFSSGKSEPIALIGKVLGQVDNMY